MRRVSVLGASGSIGQQTLSLLAAYPGRYRVVGLSVHRRIEALSEWVSLFSPEWVAVTDAEALSEARSRWGQRVMVLSEKEFYSHLESDPGDIVVNGIVGSVGFWASWHTLQHPTAVLALANKESLVFGGKWLAPLRERILPVDSEHSAVFQCLQGENTESIEKLILTASGGPFRGKKTEDLRLITPEQALRHPVWKMGSRITIDSSTLMNKALELIEAYWLFAVPQEKIEVWIHPECIIHSLVLFHDGSMKAQLSLPDMRLPILYALSYPSRVSFRQERCKLPEVGGLHFESVDESTFPSLRFAREALQRGGSAPALLNAADEVIVEAFLKGQISFLEIFDWLEWTLSQPEAFLDPENPVLLAEVEKEFRQKLRVHLRLSVHAG
ncbi:MAG: 1-deoxy-D-xylulose-5-phosphate reductoisomerase [Bacteroidia bacterium]|nr:1-deoxy-D-xylulose-5-phosphate reductoisomerase [Bacteroidia bacterium]